MDVEIGVPQTPVEVNPGTETHVPVDVRNRSAAPLTLRLSLARSRAGAWAHADPAVIEVAPGDCAAVDLVFRPPPTALPGAGMLPFTVYADDLRYGVVAGRGTGLVQLTEAQRLHATLANGGAAGGSGGYTVSLANGADEPLTLRVEADLGPTPGQVEVDPAVVDVPRGSVARAQVSVRPRRPLVGSPSRYTLVVRCRDAAAADDAAPLATLQDGGTVAPRVGGRTATAVAVVLLVLATVGGTALRGGLPDPPFGGRDPAPTPPPAPAVSDVRRPYALLDVFTRTDRDAASAALVRVARAGIPARLVDGTQAASVSDDLVVLVHDGLASVAEVEAACHRYRAVAPKCEVVP